MEKDNKTSTKPKRRLSDILVLLVFLGVLALIAHGVNGLIKTETKPGDIQVYSGSTEIVSLQRVTGEQNKKGSIAEGERFEIEKDAESFPEIRMGKSIMLEATKNPYGGMHYTVYKENFEELYFRRETFSYPEEAGVYYVVVDTMWGDRSRNISTQHGFKLIVE